MVASRLSSPPPRWTGYPLRGAGEDFPPRRIQSVQDFTTMISCWWISDGFGEDCNTLQPPIHHCNVEMVTAKWNNAQAPSFGHISGVAVLTRAAEENDSQGRSVLFVSKGKQKRRGEGGAGLNLSHFHFLLGIYYRKEAFQGSRSSSICGPPLSSANKQVDNYLIDCSVE